MVRPFDEELWQQIQTNRSVRLKLASESLYFFAHIYFSEFIRYPTAKFQKEMYTLLEDDGLSYLAIVAFRGSGKSTIATQIFAIWSLISASSRKYVLLFSLNQNQAQNHLQNIKRQIESNGLLHKDFGRLDEQSDEWGSMSLVFPKLGARISAASMGQSVRGTRHGAYRPDLIICDDIEDTETTKTREGRNKTHNWYVSEVLPLGEPGTKIVLVGNLLHEDSLMMRVKEGMDQGDIDGVFKMYPLLDSGDRCLWTGKYPDRASIIREQRKINNRIAWSREYLLKILPTDEQVIHSEWLKYYDTLPALNRELEPENRYRATYLGVDLAISQKETADYTALVAIHVFGFQEHLRIYVDPYIVNKRLTHQKTLERIEEAVERLGGKNAVIIIVENVAYQASVLEQLKNKNYRAEGLSQHGIDKRSRLMSVSQLFETGKVFLPKATSKELASQLTGFGVEKHDDLMDALGMGLSKAISEDRPNYDLLAVVSNNNTFEEEFRKFEDIESYRDIY